MGRATHQLIVCLWRDTGEIRQLSPWCEIHKRFHNDVVYGIGF